MTGTYELLGRMYTWPPFAHLNIAFRCRLLKNRQLSLPWVGPRYTHLAIYTHKSIRHAVRVACWSSYCTDVAFVISLGVLGRIMDAYILHAESENN